MPPPWPDPQAPSCCSRFSPSGRSARPPRWLPTRRSDEWDKTFADPRLCAAIADRLTLRFTLIETGTESYRLQATEAEHAIR